MVCFPKKGGRKKKKSDLRAIEEGKKKKTRNERLVSFERKLSHVAMHQLMGHREPPPPPEPPPTRHIQIEPPTPQHTRALNWNEINVTTDTYCSVSVYLSIRLSVLSGVRGACVGGSILKGGWLCTPGASAIKHFINTNLVRSI